MLALWLLPARIVIVCAGPGWFVSVKLVLRDVPETVAVTLKTPETEPAVNAGAVATPLEFVVA